MTNRLAKFGAELLITKLIAEENKISKKVSWHLRALNQNTSTQYVISKLTQQYCDIESKTWEKP